MSTKLLRSAAGSRLCSPATARSTHPHFAAAAYHAAARQRWATLTVATLHAASRPSLPHHQPARHFSFSYPTPRNLSELVNLDKLLENTTEQIDTIWRAYNQTSTHKQHVFHSTLRGSQWRDVIQPRMRKSQRLVLPIVTKLPPLDDSMSMDEVVKQTEYWPALMEIQDSRTMLVTSVDNYQKSVSAIPSLTITYFNDLLKTKDLMLVRSDIVVPTDFTIPQVEQLVKLVQELYTDDQLHEQHVQPITHAPQQYDFMATLKLVISRMRQQQLAQQQVLESKAAS